jgi:S1-C subfamily serine protease
VQTADSVRVKFLDGTWVPAQVVTSEPYADVAVLQLRRVPEGAEVAELGDSDTVAPGDRVFVVGAPLGVEHSLSAGYLSARRMPDVRIGGMVPVELLQTDAAIHEGNSGGPMFDSVGRVIGIVSYILTKSGGSQGLGFAVSSNTVRAVALERRSHWSGISAIVLDEVTASLLNVPPPFRGLLVQQVAAGSPGARMKLRGGAHRMRVGDNEWIVGGDIILRIQGVPLDGIDNFVLARDRFQELGDGDTIRLDVLRGGQVVELTSIFVDALLAPGDPEPES